MFGLRPFTTLLLLATLLLLSTPAVSSEAEEAAVYTIEMNYRVTNHGPSQAENARMTIYLFDNVSGWAEVTVLSESIVGADLLSEIQSTPDNRWVRVSVGDLGPGESKTVTVVQTLKVKAVDFSIDPDLVDNFFPPELVDAYTVPVKGLWESDHPRIMELAEQLTENTDNPYHQLKQIFDFVVEERDEQDLVYYPLDVEHGALWALDAGYGDCAEFSNLLVALARAVGIPAKVVSGFAHEPTRPGTENIDPLGHAYVIFYLPKVEDDYGWIPADAVWPQYTGSFGEMGYTHIPGATTKGEEVMVGGEIKWPGPGTVRDPLFTYQIHDPKPDVSFDPGTWLGTITPEILLEVELQTGELKENGSWIVTVTTKNYGSNPANDLTVELDLDPDFFEVVSVPRQKNTLDPGDSWSTTFDVVVKEDARGGKHLLTAKVTFFSTHGGLSGTFLAKEERLTWIPEREVPPPPLPETQPSQWPEEAAVYTIEMNYRVTNRGPSQAENVQMTIYLFDNVSGWAELSVLSESIVGADLLSEIQSTPDNRWVRVSVGDLGPGESKTVTVVQTLKVKAVDFSIDPDLVDNFFPPELVDAYTVPVKGLWESDHPRIKGLAQRLIENIHNPYRQIRQIFDFVLEDRENELDLRYLPLDVDHGALWALDSGYGDCAEFSNLLVALARAVGIPAKVVSGFAHEPTHPGTENIDPLGHAYVIFYLPKVEDDYGWIPADAVWPRYTGSFGKIGYTHIPGAITGGGEVVEDGEIEWPGPGAVKDTSFAFQIDDPKPEVFFAPGTGTITPEILLGVELRTADEIEENGGWVVTVTTKNYGRNPAENLTVELDLDPSFFEVLSAPRQKATLAPGDNWSTTFAVVVKEGAYGKEHLLTAKVTFSSAHGELSGIFLARGELSQTIEAKAEPGLPIPSFLLDPLVLLLLVGLVALIGALVAVIKYR